MMNSTHIRLYERFENLVRNLLAANGFKINLDVSPRSKYDFLVELGGREWVVEVKFYRTKRAQPSLIEAAVRHLQSAAIEANTRKAMLVVSSFLDPELRLSLEERYGILFVDRVDLTNWANQAPEYVDELAALLEEFPEGSGARSRTLNTTMELTTSSIGQSIPNTGAMLCRELGGLGYGKKHWKAYEELCEKILKYLFPNDLSGWHKQKRTDDGLNRYDLICRFSPTTDFWSFVDSRLQSRYVLFEFKNYTSPIQQGQILTTEKYLLPLALRRLGIVLCRKGADKSARLTIAGAMRESGKMMLILDDEKVCDLLHAMDNGDDPSDLLFQYSDDFLMGLNR